MGTINTEYLFSPGIEMPHVLLAIKFIRECNNNDKQMTSEKIRETPEALYYTVTHKMPDIMRSCLSHRLL